jgi:hypothetical protein
MSTTTGVKRTRCVKCNELTHSGWNLTYLDVNGRHCFKCSREVRQSIRDVKVQIGRG